MPDPTAANLATFRDRVSALARSAHGRGVEGAPALSPDEIDQQRDRMLAALFPLDEERARGRELLSLVQTVEHVARNLSEQEYLHKRADLAWVVSRLRALAAPTETEAPGDAESWPRTTYVDDITVRGYPSGRVKVRGLPGQAPTEITPPVVAAIVRVAHRCPATPPAPEGEALPPGHAPDGSGYCPRCDHDDHRCPGCGDPIPHGRGCCDECDALPAPAGPQADDAGGGA